MNGTSDSYMPHFGTKIVDYIRCLFIYYNITMTFEYTIFICSKLFVIFVSYKLGRYVRSVPENIFNKNISVVYLEEVGK